MRPPQAKVDATGFSHPPDRVPVQRRPGAQLQWHLLDCPVAVAYRKGEQTTEKCLAHPLQMGCSSAP